MSRSAARRLLSLPVLGLALVATGGCAAPLESAGKTARIEFVGSTTVGGYTFDQYRNRAYPCSISGYQTFVIGTRTGSSATERRPLFVKMRGGGVGYFDSTGAPQPSAQNKSEESAATSIGFLPDAGLIKLVRADPAGFRLVSVSMCNHDIYAGGDNPDPNNPNQQPDGSPRSVNGLFATKAAIAFAKAKYPTTKTILNGTSAGSAGSFGVAYGMEREGVKPDGVIADSGIVNLLWERAKIDQGFCGARGRDEEALAAIQARLHPELADPDNQPHLLVARRQLTSPLLHVWNQGDLNVCGSVPVDCPLPDGTSVRLGSADCVHEPMRRAIAGLGTGSRSRNLRLCVSPADSPGSCSVHVVTTRNAVNTDPGAPADYNAAIMEWVRARLAG